MSQISLISGNSPAVKLISGRPATTSLDIASCFSKEHKIVLRDIRNLCDNVPESFHENNFVPMLRPVKTGNGAERKDPFYHVYFDGFMLLVMAYTGKKALAMKLAYIDAFNAMRKKLEVKNAEQTVTALPACRNAARMELSEHITMIRELAARIVDHESQIYELVRQSMPSIWTSREAHIAAVHRLDLFEAAAGAADKAMAAAIKSAMLTL